MVRGDLARASALLLLQGTGGQENCQIGTMFHERDKTISADQECTPKDANV